MSLRSRRPETLKIDLSDGDWIVVKKHLTAGENRAIYARMMKQGIDGGNQIDGVRVGWSKMVGYLLDWSAKDPDGKPIVILDKSEEEIGAAIDGLDVDSSSEILKAVEAHEDAMEKERAQEKNVRDGGSASSPISPSLVTSTGATSGLPNSPVMSTTS
jgi:hypothetical protein